MVPCRRLKVERKRIENQKSLQCVIGDQLQTLDDDDRRHNKLDPSPYVPSPTPPPGHCYTAIIIRLQCLNSQDHKVGTTYNVCIVVTLPLAPDSMVNMHNYNIDLFYIIKQVLSPFLWNKAIPL